MNESILYFEDIQVGDKCVSMGRTVTETDIVNFAGISGDYNMLHTDAEFAKDTLLGERVAHGLLGLVFGSGLFTRTVYNTRMSPALMAFMGLREWTFRRPIKIGDTIRIEMEVLEKTDLKPDRGRVVQRRTVYNQRGEAVQYGDAVLLIKKRHAEG